MDRDDLIQRSDWIARELVQPPEDAPDVCPCCRSWRNTTGTYCTNCTQTQHDLSAWCDTVIPISLYRKPSALRDWLKLYKPGELPPDPAYRQLIGVILARYFLEQGDALVDEFGRIDGVCVVPSADREPPHDLEQVYDEFVSDLGPPRLEVVERGHGELRWRHPNDTAYRTTARVAGQRILILDDVYTTGSRSQSATSALIGAGADMPAILVVARRLNLDFDDHVRQIWERQASTPFDFADWPFWRSRA